MPVAGSAAPAGDAFATAARLHRGVNVLGYDPVWKDSARARFQPRHFATICKGGFDFIRLVLQAFDHRAAPKSVLFELLNEPHGKLDADRWNALLAQILPVVRASNPQRTLVIGPTNWNSLSKLDSLKLPASDRNILVTFHYYEPFRFTHQGAPWTDNRDLHGIPLTLADERRIGADLDTVAAWSKANKRPVLLGEFGAFDKSGTPMADRVRYTAIVRRDAEAHAFPWAYWQFDGDFIVYDIDHDTWVEPIRQALAGTP
ncbi:MAG: glycoside hydrolase family 5 protein [Lysobacteraceae bacterium]|nr:MAG: glycoside hydrolase family 5 protein [Xanthomonadaceae bacterium]